MSLIPDRTPNSIFKDVREFLAMSQPNMMHELGEKIRPEVATLAWKLIDEEVNKELKEDLEKLMAGHFSLEILARVFDHYLDIIYVSAWALEAFGLPSQAGWNEVQRANMSKFPLAAGKQEMPKPILESGEYFGVTVHCEVRNGRFIITNAGTGKVMKPMGFKPPDIFGVLHGMMTINTIKKQHDMVATEFLQDYFHRTEERLANEKR